MLKILFFVLTGFCFCDTTVVLQNGLNGYQGCTDAMIVANDFLPIGNDAIMHTSCG